MTETDARWASFTNQEVAELYDGLTMDDGIRYGISKNDEPLYSLIRGLEREFRRRGMPMPWELPGEKP